MDEKITLEVIGETQFTIFREGLQVVFWWQRETTARNFLWVRVFRFGLKWPPIRRKETFVKIDYL